MTRWWVSGWVGQTTFVHVRLIVVSVFLSLVFLAVPCVDTAKLHNPWTGTSVLNAIQVKYVSLLVKYLMLVKISVSAVSSP